MASTLKIALFCAMLVVATSGLREQLLRQLLNPTPLACRRSHFLRSLGVCGPSSPQRNYHGGNAEGGMEVDLGVEAEMEQEAGAEAEAEQGAEVEPIEQEPVEPVEAAEAGEAGEAGAEAEAEQAEVEPQGEVEQAEAEQEAEAEQPVVQQIETGYGEGFQSGGSLCGRYRFSCQSVKKCIPKSWVCNGVDNCGDGSDERNCYQQYNRYQ